MAYMRPARNPMPGLGQYVAARRNRMTTYPNVRAALYGGMGDPRRWDPVRLPMYGGLGMLYPCTSRDPMYGGMGNPSPGPFASRYRNGMGDAPINIGPSASVTVTPTGSTVTGEGASAGFLQSFTGGSSLTDFLNQNSSTLLWVGGIGLAVLLLGRLAR